MERLRQTADDLKAAIDAGLVQRVKASSAPEAPLVALESAMIDVPARVAGALAKNVLGGGIDAASWLLGSTLNTAGKVISAVAWNVPVIPVITRK